MTRTLRRFLSKYSRSPAAKRLAAVGRRYIRWVENCNYEICTNGEQRVFERLRSSGIRTLFDVGANTGAWTRVAHVVRPHAHIHCFEIIPETARQLAMNFKGEPAITVNPFGLGDGDREVMVKYYPEAPSLSLLIDYPHDGPARLIPSVIQKGDTYCRGHSIEQIDFVKIDVEGAEDLVMAGFAEALERQRIMIIEFEYGKVNILQHFLLYDAYAFLEGRGYVLGKVYPEGVEFRPYSFDHEDFRGPNYVAVLKERTDLIARLQ